MKEGRSQKDIVKLVKSFRCALQSAIKLLGETGTHANKPPIGRKSVSTYYQDRKFVREWNIEKVSSELTAALSEETKEPYSALTVRNRLVDAVIKGCKAKKIPWLSEENKMA